MNNIHVITSVLKNKIGKHISINPCCNLFSTEINGTLKNISVTDMYIHIDIEENKNSVAIEISSIVNVYSKGEHPDFDFAILVLENDNANIVFV